eukprot:Skav209988  [mRNA]  locus=scaffold1046:472030:475824:- [translate_table: standard]
MAGVIAALINHRHPCCGDALDAFQLLEELPHLSALHDSVRDVQSPAVVMRVFGQRARKRSQGFCLVDHLAAGQGWRVRRSG